MLAPGTDSLHLSPVEEARPGEEADTDLSCLKDLRLGFSQRKLRLGIRERKT